MRRRGIPAAPLFFAVLFSAGEMCFPVATGKEACSTCGKLKRSLFHLRQAKKKPVSPATG
jgi:hypothetical protein